MGLSKVIIGFLLVGIFIFAMINGGLLIASNNGVSHSIGDDPALSTYKTELETTLGNAQSDANGSLEALGKSPITLVTGTFFFDAIGGVWKTLKVVPVTVYNLTFGILRVKIFGGGFDIVLGVLSAIIIIVILFGVWKLIISGQSN
jgi:hypothetical protein